MAKALIWSAAVLSAAFLFATMGEARQGPQPGTRARGLPNRELCRREISGLYLSAFDELKRASEFNVSLQKNIKGLRDALAAARKALSTNEANAKAKPLDVELQQRASATRERVAHLASELEQTEKLHGENAMAVEGQTKEVASIKSAIDRLFVVATLKDRAASQDSYPFTISYKRECPEFKLDCPLNADEVRALKGIFADLKRPVPPPCRLLLN